jgi:hypothetical protein
MNKIICQYLNNRKGERVGCVVAIGAGKVGWSLCNLKAGDVFNKQEAQMKAVLRAAQNPVKDLSTVPPLLRDTVQYFKDKRSVRYFKA